MYDSRCFSTVLVCLYLLLINYLIILYTLLYFFSNTNLRKRVQLEFPGRETMALPEKKIKGYFWSELAKLNLTINTDGYYNDDALFHRKKEKLFFITTRFKQHSLVWAESKRITRPDLKMMKDLFTVPFRKNRKLYCTKN